MKGKAALRIVKLERAYAEIEQKAVYSFYIEIFKNLFISAKFA